VVNGDQVVTPINLYREIVRVGRLLRAATVIKQEELLMAEFDPLSSTTPLPPTNCSSDWNNHGNGAAVGCVPPVP
jgi:hypothetical protein